MAKQAALVDQPREILRRGVVEARAHAPPSLLRVPGERQLGQLSTSGAVQIAARVIAGPDRVRRLLFVDILFVSVRSHFIAPLKNAAVAAVRLIMASGGGVKEAIVALVVFDRG